MHTLTKDQFQDLYNDYKKRLLGRLFVKTIFKTEKTKITKKAVYEMIEGRIPGTGYEQKLITPAKKKIVPDTNGITKLFKAAGKHLYGIEFKRISSEGKWRKGVGYIPSTNKGFADLHGIKEGRALYVEVKQRSEKQLDSQKEFEAWVKRGGGFYIIARNFEQFQTELNIIMGKLNPLPSRKFRHESKIYEVTGTKTEKGEVIDTVQENGSGKAFNYERNVLVKKVSDWIIK